jgi:D-threo-aldose 1-dehydrogenase
MGNGKYRVGSGSNDVLRRQLRGTLCRMGAAVGRGERDSMTPALGLGIAGLFSEPDKQKRRRVIEAALDSGVRHFDLAPIYGLGAAEEEFGQIVRRRRGDVFIATKVGIVPTSIARAVGKVQAPVRKLIRASPALGQQMRSKAAGPSSGRFGALLYGKAYDPTAAQKSLDASLRSLATDSIDLLLLHDPQPDGLRFEELYSFFERARQKGQIRYWGVAGEPGPTAEVIDRMPGPTPVVQIRDDILMRTSTVTSTDSFPVTFGVLGQPLDSILAHVRASSDRLRQWSVETGTDFSDTNAVARLLLNEAFTWNRDGVVLYSTTRIERVREAADLFRESAPVEVPGVVALRRLVDDQLRTPNPGPPVTNDR